MKVEIKIPHDKITDAQKITQVQELAFKSAGVDMHLNEVSKIDDDFKKRERTIQVEKKGSFFQIGRVPWHHN